MVNKTTDSPSIGIDIGTAYSSVAVWQKDRVEILPNKFGNLLTPSYVAFTDTEVLVGEAAADQLLRNAKNTVFGITRLIGRKFSDPQVQESIRHYPFEVVCTPDDKPQVVVQFRGETRVFQPVEILAMLLSEMRGIVENYTGKEAKSAVVTVPAYFSYSQRQAVKDAGAIAGLTVMRMISQSTAASMAHGLGKKGPERKVLVVDLGGSTLDMSVVAFEECNFEVLGTAGDVNLGGDDFDRRLVDYCVAEFKKSHGRDLRTNARAMLRLRKACEGAKRALSLSTETTVELEALYDGINFHPKISRTQFESLCADIFDRILWSLQQVLSDANLIKDNIHDVVHVGGSTRIPKVKKLLAEFFNGKSLSRVIEGAAVFGAAHLAATLCSEPSPKLDNYLLLDVAPLSLGVEVDGMSSTVMIPRSTTLPTKKTETFSTSQDNQSTVHIRVFEGEGWRIGSNPILHEFERDGIPPLPCGQGKVDITFDVDANDILHVSATEQSMGIAKTVRIVAGSLPPSEIERMRTEVEHFKYLSERSKLRVEARNALETSAYSLRTAAAERITELRQTIEEAKAIEEISEETLRWLEANESAENEDFHLKQRKVEAAAAALSSLRDWDGSSC